MRRETYRTAPALYPGVVTLPGPSKTIVVEPVEQPAQEPAPAPPQPEPEPEKAPAG
jgi:hypothetical protein